MTPRWGTAFRLALPPALVSLAVTLFRLVGERLGWSEAWFSRATSGLVPESAFSWLVGITWLALPFGAYFAWRLAGWGEPLVRRGRALALTLAAVAALYGGPRLLVPLLQAGFPGFLFVIWGVALLAAAAAWIAWPALARVLLAYGLLSRLPVAAVMFLAMRGHWGTHYDYADAPQVAAMPFWSAWLLLALVPQLVFWVAFTIVAGALAGAVTAGLTRKPAA